MFEQPPPWDAEVKYKPSAMKLYYENLESGKLHSVDPRSSLKEVLSRQS